MLLPEDEILSKVQESETPVSLQGCNLVLLEIFVVFLGFIIFIVEILK